VTIRSMEKLINRRSLIKLLFFGAGALAGAKILHLPGFNTLAAASDIMHRACYPITGPCHLFFTVDELKWEKIIKVGIARKGKDLIRDMDLDSVCLAGQGREITYSSFERWMIAKRKAANESRAFYQLYNVKTKESVTCSCEVNNDRVENVAPAENLMDIDSLTMNAGNSLILCEKTYLGFKSTIKKTMVEPMNGPTRLEAKNIIRRNIAALRGLSV